jgi:hypothetical protein
MPPTKARQIHVAAKQSVAAERGQVLEDLVRLSVHGLQQSLATEKKLEELLVQAFHAIPDERTRLIASIKGIGDRTAAVLVAKIVAIQRFPTATHLTGYFGIFPEENASGVDKFGRPIPPGTMFMSRKGNDLVRKYLWMAAQAAIRSNPQVRQLYARLKARGRRGDVALGHCMRKLLHQVFGVWTSGKPYDPEYQPTPPASRTNQPDQAPSSAKKHKAAGHSQGKFPQKKVVTATTSTVSPPGNSVNSPDASELPDSTLAGLQEGNASVDFPYLRSQITIETVLRHLGYFDRLRSAGLQRRGPCPIHGSKRSRGRTFSVHLGKNVFQCFHPPCSASGNVLDLWAAVHGLTPYEAARHLAQTFDLNLTKGTEKRNP